VTVRTWGDRLRLVLRPYKEKKQAQAHCPFEARGSPSKLRASRSEGVTVGWSERDAEGKSLAGPAGVSAVFAELVFEAGELLI
jgi:hypothetical protein